MFTKIGKEISKITLNFFYLLAPNHCLACSGTVEKKEGVLCSFCRNAIQKLNIHLKGDNFVAQKFWGKVKLKYAFAYLQYNKGGVSQKLIHNLKYRGYQEVGLAMGLWYGKDLEESNFDKEFDLILPVPLHKSRLLTRGYNQSDSFAQGLSEAMAVEWSDKVIIRQLASITQTKKGRIDRWKNVEKIFKISNPNLIKNKRILLVDDVITTGSTLEACIQELLPHAKEISIATIAAGS
jgi:ComF family protein